MSMLRSWWFLTAFLLSVFQANAESNKADGGYGQLVAIHDALSELSQQTDVLDTSQWTPTEIRARSERLQGLEQDLLGIDSTPWTVSQRVDYRLVQARIKDLEFQQEVTRPWARDPGFYLDGVRTIPYTELPLDGEDLAKLRDRLAQVGPWLEQAERNLKHASGELARLALKHLQQDDGVGQGMPYRDVPPEGVLGWYSDFLARVRSHQPQLLPLAEEARKAVGRFKDWLSRNLDQMTEPAAVGLEDYERYVQQVRLMPYSIEELRALGEREVHRARTFLAIEQRRNRGLPPLQLVPDGETYAKWVAEAEQQIRAFIQKHQLLTIPRDTPASYETDAYWTERPGGKRHFWEELQYRNPLNNHIHASIPGHRFDILIQERHPNPIRRATHDGGRAEGWAVYIEEMFLQAGLLEELPRVRELFYIAQLARAVRLPAELKLQSGEFTLQQATDYMIAQVPFMEADLALYDLEIYLRNPTYGMTYIVGKVQLEQLLSERSAQLGDGFDLGAFHDEFLSKGLIPISMISWEMTGSEPVNR
jgi:hypothetical protein